MNKIEVKDIDDKSSSWFMYSLGCTCMFD